MLNTMYFVSWYIHNKDNGDWAGTIVDKYTDISAAKKSYHSQLAMYIDDPQFDSVSVMLTDSYGNKIMSEWWAPAEEPTPEPNTEG